MNFDCYRNWTMLRWVSSLCIQNIPSSLLFIMWVSIFYNRAAWDIKLHINICNSFSFYLAEKRSKGFMIYVNLAKS